MAWVLPSWGGTLEATGGLERGLVAEVASVAEEIVVEAFSLSSRDLKAMQYEIYTEGDLLFFPLPKEALAGLVRAETIALLPRKRRDFYWLLLAEQRLLSLAESRDFLKALLLYIFTHELIHMVRFARFLAGFWMPMEARMEEERRVHALTRKLLCPLPWPEISAVLSRFDEIYL